MRDLNPLPNLLNLQQPHSKLTILTTAAVTTAATALSLYTIIRLGNPSPNSTPYIPSPPKTLPHQTLKDGGLDPPYPPEDALPGARDVETPYGSIRVYEWGREGNDGSSSGERGRVLLVHGISTPVVALGDLGHELVARGYRVMMFDLFGRGYSDAPTDLPYDTRLYISQILLVLASSPHPWTTTRPTTPTPTSSSSSSPSPPGFHLIGYSLGGGLSLSFARYFPHLLRSLVLIAPCGLIRSHHVGWRSWLYYNSGLLPEFLVRYLVRRRIRPKEIEKPKPVISAEVVGVAREVREVAASGGAEDILVAEEGGNNSGQQEMLVQRGRGRGDGDANGGTNFNSAIISKYNHNNNNNSPHITTTVSSVVSWQVDQHAGFVHAFLSTIRNAPIYAPQEDWRFLSRILESRRHRHRRSSRKAKATGIHVITDDTETETEEEEGENCEKEEEEETGAGTGLDGGKICLVLGKDDSVIVTDEIISDAKAVLGPDGVEFVVLDGGHEVPITSSARVAESIEGFWNSI
ncbi:alpha/beta-hydrolase [Xylaria arbuscula]|nr:alpha/beta-hydrolase [Xylaria arbuscula]